MMDWPFAPLRPLRYGVIEIDPPWAYKMYGETGYAKSPQAHYACMSLEMIAALPVGHLAAPDCLLLLWTTWPFVLEAGRLLAAWGFEHKTGGAWRKMTVTGKTAFGTGYILRSACEPFLVGTIGRPTYGSRSERNLIEALAREHSRKPDAAYQLLDRLVPGVPRVSLFAREARPGWDIWGNETDKFGGPSNA